MELHDKYGVPNIETARELAWDKETNFYWVVYNGETFLHSISDFHKKVLKEWEEQYYLNWNESNNLKMEAKTPLERKPFWLNERLDFGKLIAVEEVLHTLFDVKEDDLMIQKATDWLESKEIEFIPAPQMHELLLYLPNNIGCVEAKEQPVSLFNLFISNGLVCYKHINSLVSHFVTEVTNLNYTQALSLLFIKLNKSDFFF